MRNVTVAASQMACTWDIEENISNAESIVRDAAGQGAQIILIQELFETPYFCIEQDFRHHDLAATLEDSKLIQHFAALAKELGVVLPVSWFEKAGPAMFNSVAMVDADGSIMGVYRKSHIPNAIGYQEKQYFNPGDTGFKVWDTRFGRIGLGICWDQWFPETARSLALMGAEILFYPTAIGDEPGDPGVDSLKHWQNAMCGHAAANMIPVVASNRVGKEQGRYSDIAMTFYGGSFIADHTGERIAEAGREQQEVLVETLDLDASRTYRETWGIWRDRRPDLYGRLMTLDGRDGEDRRGQI